MCGRFVSTFTEEELVPLFDIDQVEAGLPSVSYNICPTNDIAVVIESRKTAFRHLASAHWGYLPSYQTSMSGEPTIFNARMEHLLSSHIYQMSFASKRALIPASGFFERRKLSDGQSFYITPTATSDQTTQTPQPPLVFAGIYTWWKNEIHPNWLLTAAIVTHKPSQKMQDIHKREPLYVAPALWDAWLDPEVEGTQELLDEVEHLSDQVAEHLEYRPVGDEWLSTYPGSYVNDPRLLKEVTPLSYHSTYQSLGN